MNDDKLSMGPFSIRCTYTNKKVVLAAQPVKKYNNKNLEEERSRGRNKLKMEFEESILEKMSE